GQQQRVAVIRAFLGEPELVLADEPTSALDPVSRDRFLDEVMGLMDSQRQALIMISHDPAVASYFNKTIRLG
ncbi:MAG: ABC transporter ATP-binding protein, partial [Limnobacter sp.]|nr:ABC transporter ATP-binding protein [Limnobacter sp.]